MGSQAWLRWSLPAPWHGARVWPERDPERVCFALVLTSAFARRLCSARAGSQACLRARPRQNLWAFKSKPGTVFLHDYGLIFVLRVKLIYTVPKSASLRNLVAQLLSDNASFLIVSFYSTGALSSRRKHCSRVGVARLSGVELPGFSGPVVCESQSQIQLSRQLHPGWLTRPSEVQEGLACANCMASARGSDAFAWHPRPSGNRAGFRAWLRLPLLVPCVAPVLGPSRNSNAVALPVADACCVASVSPQAAARAFVRLPAKVYFVYCTCTDKLRPLS